MAVAGKPASAPAAVKETPEKAPKKEGAGDEKVTFTILNDIPDRMARSVAKSIFNKVAGRGGSPGDAVAEIRAALLEMDRLDSEVEATLAQLEK